MIVIAIIAILMSYAIPAYRDYTVRSKAGEGIILSASIKSTVSEIWVNTGDINGVNSGTNGLPAAALVTGSNVSQISVTNGEIEVTYANDNVLNGHTLTLSPILGVPGSLGWDCTSTLQNRYLPVDCRTP